jgi:four helix bundle protein
VAESKPKVNTYRDLVVWQRSFDLCRDVYKATRGFPKSEVFGLSAQMRRAVVSIPSNIAEGFGRRTTPDFLRSLYIAYGSVCELDTQLQLAATLGYLSPASAERLRSSLGDVERLCKALMRSLERRRSSTGALDR